ncbi:MAG: SUMF1/EgtB/PvdO family nonheme iron enzyme [Planctomycetota bacterium]
MGDPPRVFISYTAEDLVEHANVVRDQINRLEWIPVDHRLWAASGQPSVDECRERVRGCDILVVLAAHRYGWVPPEDEGGDGERSITWLEVAEAGDHNLKVLPFVVDDKAPWPRDKMEGLSPLDPVLLERLDRFKKALRKTSCSFFATDPQSIGAIAYQALSEAGKTPRKPRPTGEGQTTAYCRALEAKYRNLELLGFGEQFQIKLPIDQIYVPLRTTLARSLEAKRVGKFDERRMQEHELVARDIPVERAFDQAKEFKLRGVALLGDPGAGKTTAARRLCWQCADGTQGPTTLGLAEGMIPLHLRLRRLRPEHDSLLSFVEAELGANAKALLKQPKLLWILDGLDEVSDPNRRAEVSEWIREALGDRGDDQFIVTSRYAGYQGDAVLGASFIELNVQPLSQDQQREFVTQWYRTVEGQVRGVGAEASRIAAERSEALLKVLRGKDYRSRRLASMVANPLLLSILCVVHRKDLDLPRRRAELYDKCVDVLLEHWKKEWRDDQGLGQFDTKAARAVLAGLAWWMHQEEDRTEVAAGELAAEAGTILRTVTGLGEDGETFLQRVRDESGLLVSPDPGSYGFLHLSFQEYLASQHARENALAPELAGHFGESWWNEVGLLALSEASLPFARGYYDSLLSSDAVEEDPDLFTLGLAEAIRFPVAPFLEVLKATDTPPSRLRLLLRLLRDRSDENLIETARTLAGHSDPSVAATANELLMAAGVAVIAAEPNAGATMVHEPSGLVLALIPGDEYEMGDESAPPVHTVKVPSFWLARYPVTNADYEKFLKATNHGEPGYWTDSNYNNPAQPVVGVSWHDAKAYCDWAGFLLPSEAQWEYACRAGTNTKYWSGDSEEDLDRAGWYDDNSDNELKPVGGKGPNEFGLFDMHGNVWEWCEDTWHDSYEGAPADGSAWVTPEVRDWRVLRGGAFFNFA